MDAIVDLFHQHSRRLATLTSIVLVVLMSLSVANTVLFFIDNAQDATLDATPATGAKQDTTSSEHSNLGALNLFGSAERAAPTHVDAPETSLNLELQGVFTAADPEDSTAIIAERNKTGELYQIGDKLPGNAILNAVFDDHILIKRGSRLEKLMFSDAQIRQQFGRSPRPAVFGREPVGSLAPGSVPSTRLQDMRQRIADRSRQISQQRTSHRGSPGASIRDYVTHYRKRINSNPRAVLGDLGVSPVTAGKANGYRIGGNIPGQMLSQAGLQQGDVILSVNGKPVGNVTNDTALVDQALAAGRVRVEVQRGSRKFFLTVPIPDER